MKNETHAKSKQAALGAVFIVIGLGVSSCNISDDSDIETKRILRFQKVAIECQRTVCEKGFPENVACIQAVDLVFPAHFGKPSLRAQNRKDELAYFQARLSLDDAYTRWLEGEAGKSALRGNVCGRTIVRAPLDKTVP